MMVEKARGKSETIRSRRMKVCWCVEAIFLGFSLGKTDDFPFQCVYGWRGKKFVCCLFSIFNFLSLSSRQQQYHPLSPSYSIGTRWEKLFFLSCRLTLFPSLALSLSGAFSLRSAECVVSCRWASWFFQGAQSVSVKNPFVLIWFFCQCGDMNSGRRSQPFL